MAGIQLNDAQKLLGIIRSASSMGSTLTYRKAAELLGRVPPQSHSRAIAQMCDLLDAAACLAGVPLLALVKVRDEFGEINRQAWKTEYGPRRDAIITRSLEHSFTDADFKMIRAAIDELGIRGNRAAWRRVQELYPGDLLFRRLAGDDADKNSNAIDDLGTDVPDRARVQVWSYARDSKVREEVLRRANGRCEFCNQLGFITPDGANYLESHHIVALAKDGADRATNVIALCPNDHREAHFGKEAKTIEEKMILKLSNMNPQIVT